MKLKLARGAKPKQPGSLMWMAFWGAALLAGFPLSFGEMQSSIEGSHETAYFSLTTPYYVLVTLLNALSFIWFGRAHRQRKEIWLPNWWTVGHVALVAACSLIGQFVAVWHAGDFLGEDRPIAIIAVIGMTMGFWLALLDVRKSPRVFLVCTAQLAFIALAAGVSVSGNGTDWHALQDWRVVLVAIGPIQAAGLFRFCQWIAAREEKRFKAKLQRELEDEDKRLVTAGLLASYGAGTMVLNAVVLGFSFARTQGLHGLRNGMPLWPVALLVLAAVGNVLVNTANSRGRSAYYGAAMAAATPLFAFLLTWKIQHLPPTPTQWMGAAGAVALTFVAARMKKREERREAA